MGIEEGEEIQAKDITNIVNKMIAENFPDLEKLLVHQTHMTKIEPPHSILQLKQLAQRTRK
jgi:hypothetical protein